MPLKFSCDHCGETIEVSFLKPGELASCRKCGKKSKVPDDAIGESGLDSSVIADKIIEKQNSEEAIPEGPVSTWLYVLSGLSFIPVLGVIPGLLALLISAISKKRGGGRVVFISLAGMSITAFLIGYLIYNAQDIENSPMMAEFNKVQIELRKGNLVRLVQIIEYYRLEKGVFPEGLENITITQDDVINFSGAAYMDSSGEIPYYYELIDSNSYYLLGKGPDRIPFTNDDMVPLVKLDGSSPIGLKIHQTGKAYYDSLFVQTD